MRLRPRQMIMIVAALVMAVVLWVQLSGPSEPTYNGKSLSEWLDERRPTPAGPIVLTDEAELAVRKIGPEAIPFLLDWVQRTDSTTSQSLRYRVGIPIPLNDVWRARGLYGFRALGDAAEPAIPELVEMALKSDDRDVQGAATNSLTNNHPLAVKLLIEALQSGDSEIRFNAALVLGRLRPSEAIEPLTKALADSEHGVRGIAAMGLGFYSPDKLPQATIDELKRLAGDSDREVGLAAEHALKMLGLYQAADVKSDEE
ncbi:MAG: HEAT repeat domain-containing protein [Planctomycetaceae bacterium]|nr:HEAT repeat domain-containing protein [Planctomycetaceae bacterium]